MTNRLNRHCAYFPCHDALEDCTFCYCPFYPCGDRLSGKYIPAKDGRKIWSCKDCSWIHKKKVVGRIFDTVRIRDCFALLRKARNDMETKVSNDGFIPRDTGVVILGHGSNIGAANDSLRRLAKEIKNRSGLDVIEPAFLQLCQPNLQRVIKKVVQMGCSKVVIVPFFLFAGNHVTRDIPKIIEQEAKIYKEVDLVYAPGLGQDPRMSDMVLDSIKDAVG